jgi:hypothetical protein
MKELKTEATAGKKNTDKVKQQPDKEKTALQVRTANRIQKMEHQVIPQQSQILKDKNIPAKVLLSCIN